MKFRIFVLSLRDQVDGSQAGSGNLEILVNGGRVTSSVRALGAQRFIASFIPHEPGNTTVQITFNGETVPGETFPQFSCLFRTNSTVKNRKFHESCRSPTA